MKKLVNRICPFTIFLAVVFIFNLAAFAQDRGRGPAPEQNMANVPPPVLKGKDPIPEPAQKAILALFDKYEVVGMEQGHGSRDVDDFIYDLIRNPAFPGKVNDIAVECGTSLYQPVMDRYLAGEDVPLTEVQQFWRNTTQPGCGLSVLPEQLPALLRAINQRLPQEKKLRLLGGDPPFGGNGNMAQHMGRDENIASVMEKEVLSKHRKALMLFGTGHLFHHGRTAVATYEKDYPNVTFVIMDHHGFGLFSPLAKYNDELERHLASWPTPSLAIIKDTWLGNLDFAYIFPVPMSSSASQMVDGFLYLGPRDLLLYEHMPANIAMDKDYMAELQERQGGIDGSFGEVEVEKANRPLLTEALSFLAARARENGRPSGGPQRKGPGPRGEKPSAPSATKK
jgi:hypothetical protein